MSVIPLIIDVATVCFLVACMHYHYGNWRKHHIIVTVATFLAWFLPFMIIFVLPIDVSSTSYNQCMQDQSGLQSTAAELTTVPGSTDSTMSTVTMPVNASDGSLSEYGSEMVSTDSSSSVISTTSRASVNCRKPLSYVSSEALSILWHVVYWTSQSLTWVILPIMQSYSKAGEFTVLGKLKYAMIANAIYYGTYLLIFGVCLIYVAANPKLHFDAAQLKVLAITASNTWGLFLLVLLLGYGLVEVPRLCWNSSKHGYSLSRTRFKIAKMSIERIEAEEALEDALAEVKRVNEAIKIIHPYRRFVDTIIRKCPESFRETLPPPASTSTRRPRDDFLESSSESEADFTQSSLVRLHWRVIVAVQRFNTTQCQWNKLLENAIYLEDVSRNQDSGSRLFVRSPDAVTSSPNIWSRCRCPAFEWHWKCWLAPWSLKVLTIFMSILTVMVVWSECLFFITTVTLSLFAIFLDLARQYHYVAIEFLCVITLSYMSLCAYSTVFKMRIFNYYYIVGDHHTNENSLIFCGMMLCRLTPPLCLNFLGLLHLDTHVSSKPGVVVVETAYTKFMGHMDVIPFISNGFNVYFPIAIVLLCVLTWFNVGQRVLHLLGFQQFIGDDDMTQELIDEGAQLVGRELRKRQRLEENETRRRTYQDRYLERNVGGGIGPTYDTYSDRGSTLPDLEDGSRRRPGRTINDNDRSELLTEAEPMDYSRVSTNPTSSASENDFTRNLYQAGGAGPRPLQQTGGDWTVMPAPNPPGRYNPPRGIFDDI